MLKRPGGSSRQQAPVVWALVLLVPVVLYILESLYDAKQRSSRVFPSGNRLIFAASPGRGGTSYLRHVFGCAQDVVSRHEAEPKMIGRVLQEVLLKGRREETFDERARMKSTGIKQDLLGTPVGTTYVETTHMMVKTFLDVVERNFASSGTRVDIIVLRRDPAATIVSQSNLGWFTKGHAGKDVWYFSVGDLHPSERVGAEPATRSGNKERDMLAELVAYNADHELRARQLVARYEAGALPSSMKVIQVKVEDLETVAGARLFLQGLGLKVDEQKLALLPQADKNSRERKKTSQSEADDALLRKLMARYTVFSR